MPLDLGTGAAKVQSTLFNAGPIGYPLGTLTKGPFMLRPILMSLCIALTLSGCARLANSKLNPFNWFGRSQAVAPADPSQRRPLVDASKLPQVVDRRVLIDTVTDVTVDRTPAGGILRATGVAESQGFFNAELVLVSTEGGAWVYDFRVEAPTEFQQVGTAASRTITAATDLTARQLSDIRSIEVRGARASRRTAR